MNGKHMQKQHKKRFRLKIVDKKKFLKMTIAMSVLVISFAWVMLDKNGIYKDNNEQVAYTINENFGQDIDRNNKIANNNNLNIKDTIVTSRGNLVRDTEKSITTEKLEKPENKYISIKSGLNVRESYSTESKIVKSLAYAEQVTITEKYQDWGKIGKNQWVNMKYLSDKKPVVKKKTKNESKKQARPSTTASNGYVAFTATGYCPCSKCCGKATGITASGAKAVAGTTVAMSSKYAFGTKIEIKGMGTYTCQDRGGAIQGNKIDIFFGSHQEALNFGRRTVYVKILN